MPAADDVKAKSGEALTLSWPQPDIALVTMVREREMNTLSLELLHELAGIFCPGRRDLLQDL